MYRTGGAFVAALLIGLVNALGVVMFQQAMLVLMESIRDALLVLKRDGLALLVAEQNRLFATRTDRVLLPVAGKVRDS